MTAATPPRTSTPIGTPTLAIGVDVGGTFTKAVAIDAAGGRAALVAQASVATTHHAAAGVAEGVVASIASLLAHLELHGHDAREVSTVSISSTQAVNALLEGDVATVGVLGLAAPPHVRVARRRTRVAAVEVAPGRRLETLHGFVDVSRRDAAASVNAEVARLAGAGATALVVSGAFAVDDPGWERYALDAAAACGLPACAGSDLTGLYGLELRTGSAAVNASILPVMQRTAAMVERSLAAAGLAHVRVLVVRGDGGATPLDTVCAAPLRTLFSGPSASVAGALLGCEAPDALVVETGGTSTNIAAIVGGQPLTDYVRVMRHPTCVRSLDVRVAGVAGGSMLRMGGGWMRRRLGVGPRSAAIAGLDYASFATPVGPRAQVELVAPCAGDAAVWVAVIDPDSGRRVAVTLTDCANALGRIAEGDRAHGDPEAARAALRPLATRMGATVDALAAGALESAAEQVLELAAPLRERAPGSFGEVLGVGGAASVLVPVIAQALGARYSLADHAPVLSSIGAAASTLRSVVERTVPERTERCFARVLAEARSAAIADVLAAGADPDSVRVRTETDDARGTVRAVVEAAGGPVR